MKYGYRWLIISALFGISVTAWAEHKNTVEYSGTLVSLACVIDEQHPIEVDMGVIEEKRLYLHQESAPVSFALILKDCDPTLSDSVDITLQGPPGSITADGYLSLDKSSQASGAVIAIDDKQNTRQRLEIGSSLPKIPVGNGRMEIPLTAYLHITPEALANKSLVPGPFNATLYYLVSFK